MKFLTHCNKDNKDYTYYSEFEVRNAFACDTFYDNNTLKSEYEEYLNSLEDEEEKEDYINYWNGFGREIHETEKDYYTAMIEHEVWTSPRGVERKFIVKEVID